MTLIVDENNNSTTPNPEPPEQFLNAPQSHDSSGISDNEAISKIDNSLTDFFQSFIKGAQYLDKRRQIYYLYAFLDGLSLSYSLYKYFLDMIIVNMTADVQHDHLLTPEGIIEITAGTIFITAFSSLGIYFSDYKDKDKNALQKFISDGWPYARDAMKALRYSLKGLRNTLQLAHLLGGSNLLFALVPGAAVLGVLAAANKLLYRSMVEKRKDQTNKLNPALLKKINENYSSLDKAEFKELWDQVGRQSSTSRALSFASAAFGGMVDSLYLYMGLFALASLGAPALLAPMAAFSILYAISCVITRLYEEHAYQQKLIRTQLVCELALFEKRIIAVFNERQALKGNTDLVEEYAQHTQELERLCNDFENKRIELLKFSTKSYAMAFLMGLRHGLYAYGAVASITFVVGLILALSSVAFPPLLLMIVISSGIVLLTGFIIHALVSNYQERKEQEQEVTKNSIYSDLQNSFAIKDLEDSEEVFKLLEDRKNIPAPQPPRIQEFFEVLRSLFSGFNKGQKATDITGNPAQKAGGDGHYHDTVPLLILGAVTSLIFGIILALRALAKGFGGGGGGSDKENDSKNTKEKKEETRDTPENLPTNPNINTIPLDSDLKTAEYFAYSETPISENPSPLQNSPIWNRPKNSHAIPIAQRPDQTQEAKSPLSIYGFFPQALSPSTYLKLHNCSESMAVTPD